MAGSMEPVADVIFDQEVKPETSGSFQSFTSSRECNKISTGCLWLDDDPEQFAPASAISRVFFDSASEQLFTIRSGGATGVFVKGPAADLCCSFTMDDKGDILSVKLSPDQSVLAIQRSRKSVEFLNRPTQSLISSQSSYGVLSIAERVVRKLDGVTSTKLLSEPESCETDRYEQVHGAHYQHAGCTAESAILASGGLRTATTSTPRQDGPISKLPEEMRAAATDRSCAEAELWPTVANSYPMVEYSQACKAKSASIIGFAWTGFGSDIVFVTDQSVELYDVQRKRRCVRYVKLYTMQVNWFIFQPSTGYLIVSSGVLGNVLHPIFFSGSGQCTRHPKFEVDLSVVPKPPRLCLFDRDVSLCRIYGRSRVVVLRHRGSISAGGYLSTSVTQVKSCNGAAEIVVYTVDGSAPPRKTDILPLGVSGRFAIHVIDSLIIVHHQGSKTSQIFDIGLNDTNVPLRATVISPANSRVAYHEPVIAPSQIVCHGKYELYSANWVVFQPNIIIDAKAGLLWRLKLDLSLLSKQLQSAERRLDFLLLRRHRNSREVLYESLKQIVCAKLDLNLVFNLMKKVACVDGLSESLVNHVFGPLSAGNSVDGSYLFSVLVEYIRTAESISDSLRDLAVTLLVKRGSFYHLHQFLQYHILGDSKLLATRLLSLAPHYPPASQLALDMLYRVGCAQEEIIEAFLNQGKVIPALKVVQLLGNQDTVSARKFLQTAKQTGDPAVFYSVYHSFVQRNLILRGSASFPKGELCQQYSAHYRKLFGDCADLVFREKAEI